MKTELVSIVSHELRTPLASVLGFTALLLKREFDAPTRRHYLGIVDAQARRLAALLEDFLDVQRIEHEGVEPRDREGRPGGLLDEQARLYARQSPKHRLAVEPPAAADRPRRPRPARAGHREPALERDQVLARGWRRRTVAAERRRRPRRGPRRRARDPGGSAEPDLHEVLPRRCRRRGDHRHRPRPAVSARSSRRTAAASASTATRARARRSGSSCRGRTENTVRTPPRRGHEQKSRLAADGRPGRHRRCRPVATRSEAGAGTATITINDRCWQRRASTSAARRLARRRGVVRARLLSEGRARRSAAEGSSARSSTAAALAAAGGRTSSRRGIVVGGSLLYRQF